MADGRTCKIRSIPSAGFVLRIRCASSSVIRCSRVSLSVIEPVVAFPTPATSEPIAPCGWCFASTHENLRACLADITWRHTLRSLSPGLQQCLSEYLGPRDQNLDDKFWGRLDEGDIRYRCAGKYETRFIPCCAEREGHGELMTSWDCMCAKATRTRRVPKLPNLQQLRPVGA